MRKGSYSCCCSYCCCYRCCRGRNGCDKCCLRLAEKHEKHGYFSIPPPPQHPAKGQAKDKRGNDPNGPLPSSFPPSLLPLLQPPKRKRRVDEGKVEGWANYCCRSARSS